ncbi:MAG TPA: hypothetical protein VGN26_01130 [Armatimonadota bacterium]|jgi:hypothetical protein
MTLAAAHGAQITLYMPNSTLTRGELVACALTTRYRQLPTIDLSHIGKGDVTDLVAIRPRVVGS